MRNLIVNQISGDSKKLFPFPGDIESIVIEGDSRYVSLIIDRLDGTFYGLWFLFDYSDSILPSSDFLQYAEQASILGLDGWTQYLKDYVSILLDPAKDKSLYGNYRSRLVEDIREWLLTDDQSFELKLVQALQDTKQLEALTALWQNNSVLTESQTYKKGDQPIMNTLHQYYEGIYSCADCTGAQPGLSIGNAYPGKSITKFWTCGFEESSDKAALVSSIEKIIEGEKTKQCLEMKEKYWTTERFDEYILCRKNTEAEITDVESQIDQAKQQKQAAEDEAQQTEQDILDTEAEKKILEDDYNQCIKDCAGDAACETKCTTDYQAELAGLNALLAKLNTILDEINQNIENLNSLIKNLTIQQENLNTTLEYINKCFDQIQESCGAA